MRKIVILPILLLFLASFAFADITNDCSNVVALYHLDGDASDAHNDNDGVVTGAVYSASGNFNGGYVFDGIDDYVSVPYSQDFNFTAKNQFSVSVWVKVTSDITGNIITQYDWSSRRSWALEYVQWQGKVFRFTVYHDGGSSLFTSSQVSGITLNTWYHVVGVWDGTQTNVYVDYASSDSDPALNPNVFDSSTPIYVGSSSNSQNDFYGVIDEVAIYDKALSSGEVNQLYSAGTPIGCGSPSFDCNDTVDNDGDGLTDFGSDPGCTSLTDASELGLNECDDGVDNDGDGGIDLADSGCSAASGTDETDCGDGACEGGETCGGNNIFPICNYDCGSCPTCGDTFCDIGETCLSDNCCNGNIITGDCCSTSDCTSPQICSNNMCSDPPQGSNFSCSNPDPNWIFCDDFETGTLYQNGWRFSPGTTYWPACSPLIDGACSEISNAQSYAGNKSMRLWYPQNTPNSDRARAHLDVTDIGAPQQDKVYWRYYRMWGEEGVSTSWIFNPTRNMHDTMIFAGPYINGQTTDLIMFVDKQCVGFSDPPQTAHLVIRSETQRAGTLEFPAGVHYTGNPDYPIMPFNIATPITFQVGVWYEIQAMIKMNTVGQNDGEAKLWVNGVLVTDLQNLVLRDANHPNSKFNHFMIGPNYPPSGPAQDQSSYIDDFILSTSFINSTASYPSDTTPPTTTVNPPGGTFTSSQSVTLIRNEAGITYYSIDGVDPTTLSQVYSSPIILNQNTTLKFFSVDSAGNNESIKTEIYRIITQQHPIQNQTYNCSNPHPDWIFCDDFETGTQVSNGWVYNWPSGTSFPSCSSTQPCVDIVSTESYSGSRSMRGHIIATGSGPSNDQARAFHAIQPQDLIYVKYHRKWAANWRWDLADRDGHNTYIFAGTYTNAMTTDFSVYEDTYSVNNKTRITVKSSYQNGLVVPEGTNYVIGDYTSLPFDVATPVSIQGGNRWYEIQYMAKMNTPGLQDGEIKLWVDGILVTDQQNLILRDSSHSSIQFNKFLFGTNYPDDDTPKLTFEQDSYIDDIIISTSFIDLMQQDCQDTDGDGFDSRTCGGNDCNDYDINTQSCHPADKGVNPNNGCVEDIELTTFIALWKTKNSPVTMPSLMMAIKIWKGCN